MTAPKTLEFFVNYGCNAKCPFCFNPTDASPELDRGEPFETLAEKLFTGRAEGYGAVKFIGGEATLRDDLPKLVRLAKKLGFGSIQLTTNAIRLADAGYARLLVEAGVDQLRFSVHGHTPELHDKLVAVPGALAKVERAADEAKKLGVPVGINYVLNAVNCAALPETLPWLYRRLSAADVIVYFLRYQGFAELPANAALLSLKMSDAAASVRRAFARLNAEKLPPPTLIHFPPCAIPELSGHMLDWTVDPSECGEGADSADRLRLPDGSTGRIHEVTSEGKRHVAACGSCRLAPRCRGVEERYVARFGESEFKPMPAEEGAPA